MKIAEMRTLAEQSVAIGKALHACLDENDRLRAALSAIADFEYDQRPDYVRLQQAVRIAKAALK